jgi:acetyltransferase EpsM
MKSKVNHMTDIALVGLDLDVIDLIEAHPNLNLCGFIDVWDRSKDINVDDVIYLGRDEDWEKIYKNYPSLKLAFGMDTPKIRTKLYKKYGERLVVTIQSPLSYISKRAEVGNGCVIQHGVKIMPNVTVGKGCLLNVGSAIHHEAELGDFSILAPGSLVLGRVKIGEQVYVGSGAIIKQNCTIGSNCTIGAGAVVLKDIPSDSVVVGVPAGRKQ